MVRTVTQGRQFGAGRTSPRVVQTGTTSATPLALGAAQTQHDITTDGTGIARAVQVGTAGQFAGQRKLIRLVTRTGGSDTFTLDAASLLKPSGAPVTSLTFNAAGQSALLEWNGRRWVVLDTIGAALV
ncbi:hypothetical protein [Rhabdaerophilum sp.]|uniref:hypothetical protein n=1 Tax=Rhabdaerophilum sp. TaxID=2717341 RepID=UPI0038D42EDA